MPSYGFTVRWTDLDGTYSEYTARGRSTAEEAKRDAFEHAAFIGWTPRRWWQWWRKNDTPNPEPTKD